MKLHQSSVAPLGMPAKAPKVDRFELAARISVIYDNVLYAGEDEVQERISYMRSNPEDSWSIKRLAAADAALSILCPDGRA